MTREFKTREDLEKYLLSSLSTFSPTYISKKFGIKQSIAIKICEELAVNKKAEKCFLYQCPSCHAPTPFGGLWSELKEDNFETECEDCGHYGSDFDLMIYFQPSVIIESPKKKRKELNPFIQSIVILRSTVSVLAKQMFSKQKEQSSGM